MRSLLVTTTGRGPGLCPGIAGISWASGCWRTCDMHSALSPGQGMDCQHCLENRLPIRIPLQRAAVADPLYGCLEERPLHMACRVSQGGWSPGCQAATAQATFSDHAGVSCQVKMACSALRVCLESFPSHWLLSLGSAHTQGFSNSASSSRYTATIYTNRCSCSVSRGSWLLPTHCESSEAWMLPPSLNSQWIFNVSAE